MRSPRRRFIAAFVVLAAVVAACGGGESVDDLGSVDAALSEDGATGPGGVDDPGAADGADSDPTGEASGDGSAATPGVTDSTTTSPVRIDLPVTQLPSTVDSVGPPSQDPSTVVPEEPPYLGVLATISPDEVFAQPAAPPPEWAPGTAPLTGLAVDDPASVTRPALLAKIDNAERARPQVALNRADLVYEEQVEGGVTRLAAIYHSDLPPIGPVRSGRTTDIAIISSLNRPVFVWSGANVVFTRILRDQDIIDRSAQRYGGYQRDRSRPGTHNLMSDAGSVMASVNARDWLAPPPAHFAYRPEGEPLPAGAEPIVSLSVSYPSTAVDWAWNEPSRRWLRFQNGTAHTEAGGAQVAAANVVVVEVPQVATGLADSIGNPVFEDVYVGSGSAYVFTAGQRIPAVWTRPTLRSVPTFTTPTGEQIRLTPGTTWVELARPGVTVTR